MILTLLTLFAGLLLLFWSADRFIAAAAALARGWGLSPLVIGMVVVGFGTSAPEFLVSVIAAWQGQPDIALGNAFGSNTVNIGLILGASAVAAPLAVGSSLLRSELPLLVAASALAVALLLDGMLSRVDAAVLVVAFAVLTTWLLRRSASRPADPLATEAVATLPEASPVTAAVVWRAVGALVLLVASSRLLVWAAVTVARSVGVPDLVIGLTIVAAGTSLPELASSLAAARRGEPDLAVGNVVGSNLFNTLAVAGGAGLVAPLVAGPGLLTRDLPVMGGLTLLLFVLGWGRRGQGRINRAEGGFLLLVFAVYTVVLVRGAGG